MYNIVGVMTFLAVSCVWIPVSGQTGMILFAIFFGFGSGGLLALAPLTISLVSDARSIGLRTGIIYAGSGVFA